MKKSKVERDQVAGSIRNQTSVIDDGPKPAFIIGNGTSRLGFDLNKLKEQGTIFGCNALYRDFKPDYLIAFDPVIVTEIRKSNFPQHRVIVPPEHEQNEPEEVGNGKPRNNAGMVAMNEAIKRGHKNLYCLGFDFLIAEEDQALSNVYDKTNGYGLETRTDHAASVRRMKYLQWFVEKNPKVQFTFVFPRKPTQFHALYAANVMAMYYDIFERTFHK